MRVYFNMYVYGDVVIYAILCIHLCVFMDAPHQWDCCWCFGLCRSGYSTLLLFHMASVRDTVISFSKQEMTRFIATPVASHHKIDAFIFTPIYFNHGPIYRLVAPSRPAFYIAGHYIRFVRKTEPKGLAIKTRGSISIEVYRVTFYSF